MRRFGRGHTIAPVAAQDNERAKALIAHWTDAYAGSFVRVDITGAIGLSARLPDRGLTQVDAGVAMARDGVPPQDETVKQLPSSIRRSAKNGILQQNPGKAQRPHFSLLDASL